MAENSQDEILFESINGKGLVILNRPKSLNSFTVPMIQRLKAKLKEWETTQQFIVIKGQGERAFCSGGDILLEAESMKNGKTYHLELFHEAYTLTAQIQNLKVPWIAFIHGITMGGGVGMSIHGTYRVCTEQTILAMPEAAIGHFPDVGGANFFPKIPGKLGHYLLLTGHRLKGSDNLRTGTATHMCSSQNLKQLEHDLFAASPSQIKKVLQHYTDLCPDSKSPLSFQENLGDIDHCFDGNSVEEIITKLTSRDNQFTRESLSMLNKMCPASLKLTMELIKINERDSLNLEECLQLEFRASVRSTEGPNFIEGVRAALVDKDKNPKWEPSNLEQVLQSQINHLLSPLPNGQQLNFN